MTAPVPLNNIDHGDLRVVTAGPLAWGPPANEVTVFPTEFEALSREYPIVFRRNDAGAFRASALLGFAAGENLFLHGDDWQARTVPALMSRGPFSIGVPADGGEPMIHIDLADARVGRDTGEPLFRDHGGHAPYLDHVTGVLRTIWAGDRMSPAMFEAFGGAGLIEGATLEGHDADGRRFVVPDVFVISADRFAALDADALARLHAGDFLRCAVWLLSSLGNLSALLDRRMARERAGG